MNIQSVFTHTPNKITQNTPKDLSNSSVDAQKQFSSFLKDAIEKTNVQQVESDEMTQKLVLGENVDLHEVMIAAQKASISLNTTMEVRNKIVEAYQEIARMQV